MRTITDMFYEHGGYKSESAFSGSEVYIDPDDVTSSYVPMAVSRMNSLCMITVSVDYTASSTGDVMTDVILAELALSIADSEYDNVHVDPDTGKIENKHWTTAYRYMLDMYGVPIKGAFGSFVSVLPREAIDGSGLSAAWPSMSIATLST